MDPRHPFSRQPAQPHSIAEDPRYPPIPPPPYSSQRQDLPPHNDPFFPRRPQYENHAASPTKAEKPASYGLPPPPYPPNPFAATHNHNVNDGRARRDSYEASIIYDHFRGEENENRNGELPPQADANRIQPVPPPPPSSFHPAYAQVQYAQDVARRPTANGTNATTMYTSRLAEPSPPPPPQFNSRHMLPPTSPQYAQAPYNQNPQPPRGAPPNIPFARDLQALSTAHRPGSSMSISSMLGKTPDPPPRDVMATVRETVYQAQTKDSPVARKSHGGSPPLATFPISQQKRAHTPNSHTSWRGDQSRSRAYSGGPTHRSFPSLPENSPEASLSGPHGAQYKVSQTSHEPGKFNGTSHLDSRSTDTRRSSIGGLPLNVTFQRPGFRTPPIENSIDRERAQPSPESIRSNNAAPSFQTQLRDSTGQVEATYGNHQNNGVQGTGYGLNNRPTNQPQNRPPYGSRPEQPTNTGASSYPFLYRSAQHAPSHDQRLQGIHTAPPAQTSDIDSSIGARPEHTRQNDEKFQFMRDAEQSASGISLQPTRQALHRHGIMEDQPIRASAVASSQMRKYQNTSTPDRGENEVGSLEEPQQPNKNFLAAMLEHNRRGGRISPLPQAVQGAQGRMRGPASEPGIKNEFARMFSGIGSGVGSAMSTPVPLETGAPNSFPSSPIRVEDSERGTPLNGRRDASDQVKPRVASKGGRRSKKVKDEESRMDPDSEGVGLARSFSGRVQKRPRQSYNLQNLHNNHHHHHVDSSTGSTPFAVLKNAKRTFTPTQGLALTPTAAPHHHHQIHHHHHPPHHPSHHPPHHHHHLHHHHAAARSTPVPAPLLRRPTVTISSKAVLDSVRDLPEHHLGSKLYAPVLSVPLWKLSHEQLKFGYISTTTPLPRFEGKENCTLTIRVPRLYLQKDEREEICQRRALWGSEIYTDDSDPVAAAIHGGWIRGEWGEDIDASMLEPEPLETPAGESKDNKETAQLQMTLTSPPTTPMEPVKDRDLHITILVLPTLQSYAGLVLHGIRSRSWISKHDGLSYKIEKIEWVDEKASRGEERGGEARRKRLRALMDRRSMDVGGAFSMNFLARDLGAMKTTAVAS